MSNTAGKFAYQFHFLGLTELELKLNSLLFSLFPLGKVSKFSNPNSAPLVRNELTLKVEWICGSVLTDSFNFVGFLSFGLEQNSCCTSERISVYPQSSGVTGES